MRTMVPRCGRSGRAKALNALKRRVEGITQKALTDALRRLERNGIVVRRVIPAHRLQLNIR